MLKIRVHDSSAVTSQLQDLPFSADRDAYSIYSQVQPISGGRLLCLQPEDAPRHGDKGPTSHNKKSNIT
jgi:hypothetical protein